MEFAQSSKKYNIFLIKTHFKSMQTIGPVFRPVSAMKDESYCLENWAMAISVQLHLV